MTLSKQAAAKAALSFVKNGMKIGIGTGSTVKYFIEELALEVKKGLNCSVFSTSKSSDALLLNSDIPVISNSDAFDLDIDIDGADEIDDQMRMIKGGGGALFREKIVAAMSKQMIVIVDENKCVKQLGAFPLPLEISPFGFAATIQHVEKKGFKGTLRKDVHENFYLTDNNNYIYDIDLKKEVFDFEELDISLRKIPGVIETGLFLNLASKVIIGYPDGQTVIR